jgi:phosphatidylglycerophosphatase C
MSVREKAEAATPTPLDGARLIAFDFDGTLTVRDSFVAFLGSAGGLLALAPEAIAYPVSRDRGRLKSAAIRAYLRGVPRAVLEQEARDFAASHFERLMRPDALAAWARHRAEGAHLVIVTASPEEIVGPFAERLGADALIGSRLLWTIGDHVGDGLDGANCRGAEKVARLRARFGLGVGLAVAYGDTAGDREMLQFAEVGAMRRFSGRP